MRWAASRTYRTRSTGIVLTFEASAWCSSRTASTSSRPTTPGVSPRPTRPRRALRPTWAKSARQDRTRTPQASWAGAGWKSRSTPARRISWRSCAMPGMSSPRAVGQAGVPDKPPQLLVAGSVALDTRDGPFGKVKETLGGSAVYFALAASLIVPVKVVAPVGGDGAKRVAQAFSGRPIDTEMLEILEAPTYRWRARQEHGRNIDLGSSDNIYDKWEPSLPAGFDGWAFVGSMRPDRQAQAMGMLGGAKLLAADAMLSYVQARPPDA